MPNGLASGATHAPPSPAMSWEGHLLLAGLLTPILPTLISLLPPSPHSLLLGEDAPRPRSRQIGLTAVVVLISLAVALAFPTAAEVSYLWPTCRL